MEASSSIGARKPQALPAYALVTVLIELIAAGYDAVASRLAAMAAARRQALLRRELHALNDHFLRDIGLRREEIDRMFR